MIVGRALLLSVVAVSTGRSAATIHLDRIPACEGACIDPEFLERVIGAAEVTVSLERARASIALDRWLLKPSEDVDLGQITLSPCVPDRAALASRLKATKREPYDHRGALEMALSSNEYALVLFLGRGSSGRLEARCARELAINWSRLRFFEKRLAWLRERLTGVEHCTASGVQTRATLSAADQLQPIVGARGECAAGLKRGTWVYDLGAGMTDSGQYDDAGRRVGLWVFQNGPTYTETTEYRDGRKNGRYVGLESGNKIEEGVYTNGLRTGTWRAWSPSGALSHEEEFREGAHVVPQPGRGVK